MGYKVLASRKRSTAAVADSKKIRRCFNYSQRMYKLELKKKAKASSAEEIVFLTHRQVFGGRKSGAAGNLLCAIAAVCCVQSFETKCMSENMFLRCFYIAL